MAYRQTRTSVRTSKPAASQQQQHISRNFVSGGSVHPNNTPVVVLPEQQPPQLQQQQQYQQQQPRPAMAPVPMKAEARDKDGDVTMGAADDSPIDPEQFKAEKRQFFLKLKKVTGGVNKKAKRQMMQRKLRKHVAPKNATVALQELRPGVQYVLSVVPGAAPPQFIAEVEVDGKKYQATGSNKALARAAAAERALQSFVPPPAPPKDPAAAAAAATGAGAEAGGEGEPEDNTPWSTLASFALHKLFCDWRQGRVGAPLSLEAAGPAPAVPTPAPGSVPAAAAPAAANNGAAKTPAKPKPPKAPKALPTDADARHPVMLLHEMRPNTTFEVTEQRLASAGAPSSITVTAYVDGLEFKASARGKKDAKRLAAKAANTALFGVQYTAEMQE